ncbi:MAG: hypothetical protein K0S54_301 [Alphaproteobacteria bacterium]|jgi:hypothetical protein|nr:hypothetical protein [Alphaproteobacteria bacterium]
MNFQGPVELESVDQIDFYSTVHKGLRRGLYEASQALAMADANDDEGVIDALDRLHGILRLLGKLGGTEAIRIYEFLEATRPGSTQAARADSERHTLAVGALLRLEKEVRAAGPRDRPELLGILNSSFTELVGEALMHMADAELEVMPLLRESGSYEELSELRRQFYADLGRDAVMAMAREVLQAVGARERLAFLKTVQRAAPSAIWPSVWWMACAIVSQNEREDFTRILGVDCTQVPLGQTF